MPSGVVVADDDAAAAAAAWAGAVVFLRGGDMLRTLGGPSHPRDSGRGTEVAIDLMEVRVDGQVVPALSHVLVRGRRIGGGSLRGPVDVFMNAQFIGGRDLAPRGHPNDGRVEHLGVDPAMGVRQRLLAWRRARNGSHLPHPGISSTSIVRSAVECRGRIVVADGEVIGPAATVEVVVAADRAHIWF